MIVQTTIELRRHYYGINGLVVRAPFIYVLTSQGAVYKFNQEDDVSAKLGPPL